MCWGKKKKRWALKVKVRGVRVGGRWIWWNTLFRILKLLIKMKSKIKLRAMEADVWLNFWPPHAHTCAYDHNILAPYTKKLNQSPLCICCHRKMKKSDWTHYPELSTWTSCKLASHRQGERQKTSHAHAWHTCLQCIKLCVLISLSAGPTMNPWLWLAFLQSCTCLKHSCGPQLGEDPGENSLLCLSLQHYWKVSVIIKHSFPESSIDSVWSEQYKIVITPWKQECARMFVLER